LRLTYESLLDLWYLILQIEWREVRGRGKKKLGGKKIEYIVIS
jgi:hypothetical protein